MFFRESHQGFFLRSGNPFSEVSANSVKLLGHLQESTVFRLELRRVMFREGHGPPLLNGECWHSYLVQYLDG